MPFASGVSSNGMYSTSPAGASLTKVEPGRVEGNATSTPAKPDTGQSAEQPVGTHPGASKVKLTILVPEKLPLHSITAAPHASMTPMTLAAAVVVISTSQ